MVDWSTIYDTVFVIIDRIHNGTDLPACLPTNHHHVVVPLPSLLLCHAICTRDHPATAATAARSIHHYRYLHYHHPESLHYHYHLHYYYYYHGVGENDQ